MGCGRQSTISEALSQAAAVVRLARVLATFFAAGLAVDLVAFFATALGEPPLADIF